MKHKTKKLTLNKTTITRLNNNILSKVNAGGQPLTPTFPYCDTMTCNMDCSVTCDTCECTQDHSCVSFNYNCVTGDFTDCC